MRLLLDTNVLINIHHKPSLLGKKTRQSIEKASTLYFSPLSYFELLQKDDYLGTNTKKVVAAMAEIGIQELPLTASAALTASRFGSLRGTDPLDFLILAQAAHEDADLMTSDRKLLELGLPFVRDSTL